MLNINKCPKCGGRVEEVALLSNPPIYKKICENCGEIKPNIVESVDWTKDVVYKVYCNYDLNTLPIPILEDMKDYIEEIIRRKQVIGLTKDKKKILKELMGSASSEQIDFNKVRDEWRENNE